jgi:histidinol-phosphatase (PHP family)
MQIPRTTYHCHTTFSDGLTTLPELVEAAADKGMTALGLSDHLVLHPTLPQIEWSMRLDQLDAYVASVVEYRDHAPIPVYLGIEADFFVDSPRAAELEDILARYPFDYVIGSVHMIGEFPLDSYRRSWEALTPEQVTAYHIQYWSALEQMVQTCPWVDVIGHLDLPKKFGFLPDVSLDDQIAGVLDTIGASGKAIELNTAGWDKPCAEGYPGRELLASCRERNIPLVVNDDAHSLALLARYYDRATAWLTALGYEPAWHPVRRR